MIQDKCLQCFILSINTSAATNKISRTTSALFSR